LGAINAVRARSRQMRHRMAPISKQKTVCEGVKMTDRTQRFMQACALFVRQPLHQDLVAWRPPVIDIGDLLRKNEFEEFAMRERERVEINIAAEPKTSDSGKPGWRRALK
jgi:hypothetical protein